ncbi:Hypothetical predicted protein [Mytilus galloprovincialis]|uniref:Uncharacterized protein n=1 Tax=Mytilus galloprovincialis TaxID=29158 RepID=A0A8B6CZB9_MYTGA|nr:Hypothetical predicted protein [Mytilus galloprovincialis]
MAVVRVDDEIETSFIGVAGRSSRVRWRWRWRWRRGGGGDGYKRKRIECLIKTMDEFYLFVNSGDSLQLFPQNRGGQFRIRLPRSHLMKGTWECALLEMTFVPAFETSTQRMYVCCDLVRDESYVRDTYLPLLQSVAIRKEETTEIIFERPLYLASRGGETEILEITLRDDRLRVCRCKDDHVFCLLHFRQKL